MEKTAVIINTPRQTQKSQFSVPCIKIAIAILKGSVRKMGRFDDYGKVGFGDERLNKRFPRLIEQLAGKPSASISAACLDPYQAKAAYRFIGNDEVTTEALTNTTRGVTIENIKSAKPSILLIPQDTTDLNYTNLKATEGLGTIAGSISLRGFYAHSAIAVSESGDVYGLLAQKMWVRQDENFGVAVDRSKIPIEEKESYRWLETMVNAQASLPEDIFAVHICDREGDIFELFCKAGEIKANYLCRIQYNRIVNDEDDTKKLLEYIAGAPEAGRITLHVPRDSHTKRAERDALLEIKYGKCTLPKPRNLAKNDEIPESIEAYFVAATETDAPNGQEKILWRLITNVTINSFEEAVTLIQWYTQRWKIETFHKTLKSGCKVEELQYESAKKLMKLTAIYSIIALQIMDLSYMARTHPEESCEKCLTEDEWKILYRVAKKTKKLPEKPPTIKEAVVMIAKLGGFLARKSDGFPGVTVIWRGLTSFYTILDAVPYLG